MRSSAVSIGVFFLALLAHGQATAQAPPYPVMVTPIVYSDMTTVVLGEDISFQAWHSGNETDVIDLASPGVNVGDGWILFDLSVFQGVWEYGDTLVVEVHGAGSNYTQPETREFSGIIAEQGIQWITELGPGGEFYLPVELTAFWAKPRQGAVTLQWVTRSEMDNAGYNLFRSTNDGIYEKVNAKLIPGAGTSTKERTYRYVDHPPYPSSFFYRLECLSTQGEVQILGTIEVRMWRGAFKLYAASPSPLVENTRISFELPVPSSVNVVVYDLSGRAVQTLQRGELGAGIHTCVWDGRDTEGQAVGNGLYFVRVAAGDFHATERIVVMR